MVGTLTSMKFAMLRHSPKGTRQAGWVIGGGFVLLTWAAGVAADREVRSEILTLTMACWFVGAALGPVTMSGAGVLRAEYFTLLPLDRKKLAVSLLGAVFPGVASAYLLLAVIAVTVHAAASGPAAVVIGVATAAFAWVITITVSRLVYAALGSAMRTWLGVEIAGLQFGFIIGGLLAGWMVVSSAIQSVPELLRDGLPDGVAGALAWFPTSWPVRAVEAASVGDVALAVGWLAASVVVALALLGLAAILLRPSLGGRGGDRRRRPLGSGVRSGRSVLPDTEMGAVVGKELRQWWRDPWRKLEWRSGIYTGLVIGLFCYVSGTYQLVAPLAGLVIVFMICLSGCNLYGQDGSALWLTIVGQRADTVVADVRGRQLAMVVLFVPPALLVSAVLITAGGEHWAWPMILAGLPALVGVASGIAILLSVVAASPGVDPRRRVGPNDAGGDLSVQAQIAIWTTVTLVSPTTVALLVGYLAMPPWGRWVAVVVGMANGVVAYWLLGRLAVGYLRDRLPTLFTWIRYGRRDDKSPTGLVGMLENVSRKAEQNARAAKEKEKAERAQRRAAQRDPAEDVESSVP